MWYFPLILHFQPIAPLVDYLNMKIKIFNRSLSKTVHFIKEILKSNSHFYIYLVQNKILLYFLCILLLKIVTNKFSLSTFFFFLNFLPVKFTCLSYPNKKFKICFREKSEFFKNWEENQLMHVNLNFTQILNYF